MKWSHTFPHLKPWCSILLMDLTEASITLPMFISPKTHPSRKGKHINAHGSSHCCDIGCPALHSSGGTWAGESTGSWSQTAKRVWLGKDKGGSKTLLMPWLDQAPALPGPCLLENHKILDCQPGRILESNTIIGQKPRIHRGKRRYHGYQWQNQDENPGVLLLAWGFAFLWRLSRIFKSLGNRELQRSSNSDFIQR